MNEWYDAPVSLLHGVGEERAKAFAGLGIETVGELLEYFPSRYEDYRVRDLTEVKDGERVTLAGTVYGEPSVRFYGKRKSRISVKLVMDRVVVTAVWFNQTFVKSRLSPGKEILVTGKWDKHKLQITVSEMTETDSDRAQKRGELAPIYPLGGDVTHTLLRKTIQQALRQYGEQIPEILPTDIVSRYRLMPRPDAIRSIHFPQDAENGRQARRRIMFEELFLFQLKMQALRRIAREQTEGTALQIPMEELRTFVKSLPFPLTDAQKRVIKEILTDMRSPYAMNRLLQGDVGSGKTVVAAIALFAAVKAGFQGALMVPTEILAEQHVQSLTGLLSPHGIQVALLSGSLTAKRRREVIGALQMGLIDVVVGTHALIQEDVFFSKLGLVITDEQHRFGVEQRRILRNKGLTPDVLFMTATPIPRTLAISAFGDMDVSTIDQMPAGRKPIETTWKKHEQFHQVLEQMREELVKGRQAYVICPLIEESEKLDVQNAIDVHAQLSQVFPEYGVGLMHGRLPAKEKDAVMQAFLSGEYAVLVSTTVVEVGVNVPNATFMIIYDAERFGLAQLHQLRGRVGRGSEQSYCVLIADPKSEIGKERMRVMCETTDGFELSRRDLELRGPGDFFGTKQSGLPEFKVADLMSDFKALEVARQETAALVEKEEFWKNKEYVWLRSYLKREGVLDGIVFD
ncbi:MULTISPECIES: ATP-dependent DNA helicase RecG [Brevibacillus]|jgi:ATP-dependent DNA helicase RecG|uniref:ATP-dependent DNA helicase RecG n=1 Tax=Brevibacillus TaxID=55080 RepID=UPI0004F279E3|nr:ATP-dependent DNA helicase RecG [Brevibacillus borstelensis]KKX54114.1 ATP-dependent DNA helicase [Brevibacillus borstelensis cifa_chp40]MBE5398147.1 ATP-dependent DNA helicase RecG [Brevibacillus borstelensis]MCC0564275.1 ATP-dependent DNA helicase RecG [Brevibacillus borstelensis]MED1872780.1 ATP-dependent DNA helicase RecG [Brevibacillus borstelensis]NOU54026.1 ATP-dependent DNA helicase RecG [Brevibacillus borstelensis]